MCKWRSSSVATINRKCKENGSEKMLRRTEEAKRQEKNQVIYGHASLKQPTIVSHFVGFQANTKTGPQAGHPQRHSPPTRLFRMRIHFGVWHITCFSSGYYFQLGITCMFQHNPVDGSGPPWLLRLFFFCARAYILASPVITTLTYPVVLCHET